MKCRSCDVDLTDFEATRKRIDIQPEVYVDLCNSCFAPVADFMAVTERWDLFSDSDVRESEDIEGDGEDNGLFVSYEDDEYVDDLERSDG